MLQLVVVGQEEEEDVYKKVDYEDRETHRKNP
jgi:hypothetical protein